MHAPARRVVFALLLTALGPQARAADAPRPNVLWICADDHAAYVCGAYGNQIVRTPSLDALAAGGMRFDRAFCNSPVCTASRQSFLTGRYPRTIGVTQLQTPLPESETTLAEMLRDAGYETASIGKMHFNSHLKHGFETRVDMPEQQAWLKVKGKGPLPSGVETQPPWKPFRDPASVWLNSANRPFAAVDADMPGTYFADRAAEFLAGRKSAERPFFLMVSFYEPHSPFYYPVEFRGRHKPEEFTVPAVGPEDDWQVPAIFRDLTPAEKQGINAAYYTSAEFLDRNVGRVLAALERGGLAENTLVVYTGDHGYMLGQHGRFEKHCCYEPAIRAPLFVRHPKQVNPGGNSALVEFIDIAPTILEFCGAPVPPAVQGRSMLPLLTGRTDRHRDEVYIEYSENEEAAVRTERWKFVYTTGKRERQDGYTTGRPLPGRTIRLYDLERDPNEMTNVAERPENAALVAGFVRKLAEHLRRTAREPALLPRSDDVYETIDEALQPRDVPAVKIVTLGDSITRGVRAGVAPDQTFAAIVQAELGKRGIRAEVKNVGIGGERTDGALARLETDVLAEQPRIVTLMYGTNDSFVDKGAEAPRLSAAEFRQNLAALVTRLKAAGVTPVLMTEPRWGPGGRNGLDENPNALLAEYVAVCRSVAKDEQVPLVDHFAHWTKAEAEGTKIADWTTDQCHPNPAGHRVMAELMLPTVVQVLNAAPK